MKAIFKNKERLILNSADGNEQIMIDELITKADSGNFDIKFNKLLDINGDVDGMSIELLEKTELSTPTETEE